MIQQIRMQAAASRDKKQGKPGNDEGTEDPNYENITLPFRKQDQLRGSHSAPTKQDNQTPGRPHPQPWEARPRPSPDTAQVPAWLHRSIMSLYGILALTFLFCIILSALVLVKNSEMSRELLGLRMELWNVSNSMRDYWEEQRKRWSTIRNIHDATKNIKVLENKIQDGNDKLKMVPSEIAQISKNIQKILEILEKTSTHPTP